MIMSLAGPVLVSLATFGGVLALMGGSVAVYIDLPSLVIVPVMPLAYMTVAYGMRATGAAFRVPLRAGADAVSLKVAQAFWTDAAKALWLFGIVGALSGGVQVLARLDDPEKVGVNLAVAMLTMLYAAFFNLIIAAPYAALARKRIASL